MEGIARSEAAFLVMDCDAKMPSWDLGTVVGGGGGGALDLKLGGPTSWRAVAAVAPVPLPPPTSAPAKRPRAGQGQQQVAPACSVEGCAADLSKSREYHRRHKVCEAHSKTPVVAVAGQQQRFCQQCSRFHLLVEFDEAKRSCRKRLDGHNRRRRKPQPDPLNPAAMFAGVPRFASYPQIFSPQSMAEHKWGGVAVKTEADAFHEQYYPAIHLNGGAGSIFHGKVDRKHFPFMTNHGGDPAFGSCQPPPFTITPSSESSSNSSSRHSNGKMFPHDGGPDTCALSLLSDNPASAHMMIPPAAPSQQSLVGGGGPGIHYNDGDVSLTGMSYVTVGDKGSRLPMMSTNTRHSAATNAVTAAAAQQLQYHGYYHHHHHHQVSGDQGNTDAGAMQALPFSSW